MPEHFFGQAFVVYFTKSSHHNWECPPRFMLDRSVYQPTKWTVANVAYLSIIDLGGHAHLLVMSLKHREILKRVVMTNHTYTRWHNTTPLRVKHRAP